MATPSRSRPRAVRIALLAAAVAATMAAAALSASAEPAGPGTEGAAVPAQAAALPTSYTWSSSAQLIGPKPDATHSPAGIKDPSVVYSGGRWHVFASTASSAGYNLMYTSFTDWSQAAAAPHYYLDRSGIGTGYRAAPEVFYFEPDGLWYLVYQDGNAAYSTNPDIANPAGWSAPKHFYSGMPQIIEDNIGSGYWVDMWVTCDSANCHLFSSDDNGHLYRSQTTVANFPNGMSDPVIAMEDDNKYDLWEASNVYKVQGADRYLLLIEAFGVNGARYFRSWTSADLAGPWTALADSTANPFAAAANTTFPSGKWTEDISHGEMIRAGVDQRLEIDPCNMRYLYQGRDPASGGDYNSLPWRLGLLTQTNSSPDCGDPGEEPTTDGPTTPPPAGACTAEVAVVGDWGSGWQGTVTVTAGEDALSGWSLTWEWPGSQRITSAWNADWSQSGAAVTAGDVGWNGAVAAGRSREAFGFVASGASTAPQIDCAAA